MTTIKNNTTQETYETTANTKQLSRVVGYRIVPNSRDIYALTGAEIEKLMSAKLIRDTRPASKQPATERQLAYLVDLGVDVNRPIDKELASRLIDAVKSGEGVGHLGFRMIDGSN